MLKIPPIPYPGRNLSILRATVLKYILRILANCSTMFKSLWLQRPRAKRWIGTTNICNKGAQNSWNTRSELFWFQPQLVYTYLAAIGGTMKAAAIASISLVKRSKRELMGKGSMGLWGLSRWVYTRSFMRLVTVLTANTARSFWMGWGISGVRLTWSMALETEKVGIQTAHIHLNQNPLKKMSGCVKRVRNDFPAAFQMVGSFLLANSMTDLSTTVLRGETQMPVVIPASIYAMTILRQGCRFQVGCQVMHSFNQMDQFRSDVIACSTLSLGLFLASIGGQKC